MVECTGLENRRAARSRGFESLSLRQFAAGELAEPLTSNLKPKRAEGESVGEVRGKK